jgi:RNase P/RNase MRP subunit p30
LKSCKNYLCKETKLIDFKQDELETIFHKILNINRLRNLIAHHNGNLIKDKSKSLEAQKDFNIFNLNKQLKIYTNGQVYINNSEYIKNFIQDSRAFMHILVEQLKNKT